MIESFYDSDINEESYLSLSSELTASDNLSQRPVNSTSGFTSKNSAYLSYQMNRKKNKISINYDTFYTIYNKDEIENELYWFGSANLYQNIYFKQLYLSLIHQRNRYLIEPNGPSLPKNQGDRDIFTINPKWQQQTSLRSSFEIGYSNTNINYSNNSSQNSKRNGIELALTNKINKHTDIKLMTTYDDVKFTSSSPGYEQVSVSLNMQKILPYGSYSLEAGLSKISQNSSNTTNPTASIKYNYKKNKHDIGIILRKTLTDTSAGLGLDSTDNGDFNASTPEVIDRDRVEVYYKHELLPKRLINTIRMYFDREEGSFSLNNTPITNTDYQRGLANTFTIFHNPTFSSAFTLDFRRTDRQDDGKHNRWLWQISTSYQISTQLLLTASTEYIENNDLIFKDQSYDETHFKTKITFKY